MISDHRQNLIDENTEHFRVQNFAQTLYIGFKAWGAVVTSRILWATHCFLAVEFSTVLLTLPASSMARSTTLGFHGVGRFGGLQGFLNYQLAGQPVYYRVMEGDIR